MGACLKLAFARCHSFVLTRKKEDPIHGSANIRLFLTWQLSCSAFGFATGSKKLTHRATEKP